MKAINNILGFIAIVILGCIIQLNVAYMVVDLIKIYDIKQLHQLNTIHVFGIIQIYSIITYKRRKTQEDETMSEIIEYGLKTIIPTLLTILLLFLIASIAHDVLIYFNIH